MRFVICFISMFIFSIFVIIVGCSKNPTESANNDDEQQSQNSTFVVKTFHNWTIEEYSTGMLYNTTIPLSSLSFDYPLEIELLNYKIGDNFKGRVKLANLGWIPIDTTWIYANPGEFVLNVYGIQGFIEYGIHSIFFEGIEIANKNMKGSYCETGPYVDPWPHDFTAIKK